MSYIKKKEGNLLVPKALFNGHWQEQGTETIEGGEGNLAFFPHHRKNKPAYQKEIWMGYASLASVLMVFCGLLVVQNMKTEEEGSRGLASDPFSTPEMNEEKNTDDSIIEDLNSGRRDLSSVNEFSLEEREYFEHTVLNSYYVSFDAEDVLSEVQLRPEKIPIYIKDHKEFIQKNRDFFPEYSQIQDVKQSFDVDEKLKTSVYRMANGSSDSSRASFQTDEQGMLISILIENQE